MLDHPDFTGEWTLDLQASDSLDSVLKALGRLVGGYNRYRKIHWILVQPDLSITITIPSYNRISFFGQWI